MLLALRMHLRLAAATSLLDDRQLVHALEIANRIGTTRETVTRMLKDLERQGLIRVEGREIVLQPGFERAFD